MCLCIEAAAQSESEQNEVVGPINSRERRLNLGIVGANVPRLGLKSDLRLPSATQDVVHSLKAALRRHL